MATPAPGAGAGHPSAPSPILRTGWVLGGARRADARPPRPLHPDSIARGYDRQLQGRVNAAHRMLLRKMAAALAVVGDDIDERAEGRDDSWQQRMDGLLARVARADSAKTDLDRLLRVVTSVEQTFGKANEPDEDKLSSTAAAIDNFTTKQTIRTVKAVLDIDIMRLAPVRDLHIAWTDENVGLIKSIDERYFADIRDMVIDTVKNGKSTKQLAAELAQRHSVSKSRAELIAQDQVAKLNAQITKARQTGLGVTKFRWSTSLDQRVRKSHKALEGKIFTWADGAPGEGIPGHPVRCRCVGLPVFE